jgi:hypothetical protein
MFEERLKKISKELGEESKKEFYILTHKEHRREIYFQNKKESIKFLGKKLNSPLKKLRKIKKILNILIKIGILQLFLKKMILSSKIGDVVYVAGQIKSFDLKNRIVTSFTRDNDKKESFINSKEFQKKFAEKGFAPKIFELNKKIPFSKEELLSEYKGGRDIEVFKKLISFYNLNKIKEIALKEYVDFLNKKLKKSKIKDSYIKIILDKILSEYNPDTKLKIVTVHGDFAKEQILLKNNSFVFIDWCSERDIILRDLIKFFRGEDNLLKNKKFKKLLKIYPENVQKNVELYIILNEIYSMIRRKAIENFPKKRIENVLG